MNRVRMFVAMVLALLIVPVTFVPAAWADVPRVSAPTVNTWPATPAPLPVVSTPAEKHEEAAVLRALRPTVAEVRAKAEPVLLAMAQAPGLEEVSDAPVLVAQAAPAADPCARHKGNDSLYTACQNYESRLAEEKKEGERIRDEMKKLPNPKSRPLTGTQNPAPVGATSRTTLVELPAVCDDMAGKVMAAVGLLKGRLTGLEFASLELFLRQPHTCGETVTELSKYVDLSTVEGYSYESGPTTKRIITDTRDLRLADYDILYGYQFTQWRQQLLGSEFRTPEDFRNNMDRLTSHVQYLTVPTQDARFSRLEDKVNNIKAEAPDALKACFSEPVRFAVGVCRWADAKDYPYWVASWATRTIWGVHYAPDANTQQNAAPILIVWLPKAQEFVFWAGPCGGNGGWLPSAPAATFRVDTNNVNDRCERVATFASKTGDGDTILPRGGSVDALLVRDITAVNAEVEKLKAEGSSEFHLQNDWRVFRGGQQVAVVPMGQNSTPLPLVLSEPGEYVFRNMSAGAQDVKACAVKLVRLTATADCKVLGEAKVVGSEIQLPSVVKKSSDFKTTVTYTVDNIEIPSSLVRTASDYVAFPLVMIRSKPGTHTVGLRVADENGNLLANCPGSVMIGVDIPAVNCDSISARFEKGQIEVRVTVNGNTALVKAVRFSVSGMGVADRPYNTKGIYQFPDDISDEAEHFVSVELVGQDGELIGGRCTDHGANNRLQKQLHCSCDQSTLTVSKNGQKEVTAHTYRKGRASVHDHDTKVFVRVDPSFTVDETGKQIPLQDVSGKWTRTAHLPDGKTLTAEINTGSSPVLEFFTGDYIDRSVEKEQGSDVLRTYLPSRMHKHGLPLFGHRKVDQQLIRTLTEFHFVGTTADGKTVQCTVLVGVGVNWKPIIITAIIVAGVVAAIVLTSGGAAAAGFKTPVILTPF